MEGEFMKDSKKKYVKEILLKPDPFSLCPVSCILFSEKEN